MTTPVEDSLTRALQSFPFSGARRKTAAELAAVSPDATIEFLTQGARRISIPVKDVNFKVQEIYVRGVYFLELYISGYTDTEISPEGVVSIMNTYIRGGGEVHITIPIPAHAGAEYRLVEAIDRPDSLWHTAFLLTPLTD